MKQRYSMVIQWSDEDQLYITWLPEWGQSVRTHGKTYEEAARRGEQLLETMLEIYREDGRALPEARTYDAAMDRGSFRELSSQ